MSRANALRAARKAREARKVAELARLGVKVPAPVSPMVRLLSCRYSRDGKTIVEVPEVRLFSTRQKAVRLGYITECDELTETGKDVLRAAGVTP